MRVIVVTGRIILTESNVEKQYFTNTGCRARQYLSTLNEPDIVHFSHWRIFRDGSGSIITTHPGFSVLFVKKKFYEKDFAGKPQEYRSGLVFYEDLIAGYDRISIALEVKKLCVEYDNYKPDVILTEVFEDFTDFYCFGTRAYFFLFTVFM
jgi:hypothetical protein